MSALATDIDTHLRERTFKGPFKQMWIKIGTGSGIIWVSIEHFGILAEYEPQNAQEKSLATEKQEKSGPEVWKWLYLDDLDPFW